jgi:uncharacterized OB-fold protein
MSDEYLPIPDQETAPFWKGLAEGKFLLKWCESCEKPHYYPRDFCPYCWSEQTVWREASGRGVVFATTVVRQMGLEPFASRLPYNISIIELEEGPRLLSNVVGTAPDQVRIGMSVRLAPEVHDEIGLPLFEPAD